MTVFKKITLDLNRGRTELHDALGLTGCEVSVNRMAPDTSVPFVHSHRQNEECYVVLNGDGALYLDGEVMPLVTGDCFVIPPTGRRCLHAGAAGLQFVCIQSRAGSLTQYTKGDADRHQERTPWTA